MKKLLTKSSPGTESAGLLALIIGTLLIAITFASQRIGAALTLGALATLAFATAVIMWSRAFALLGYFLLYSNALVAAGLYLPKLAGIVAAVPLVLFVVRICDIHVLKREPMRIDTVFSLMLGFLAVLLASTFMAEDLSIAIREVVIFVVEGLGVYLLTLNIVRTPDMLKRVLWSVLLAGALLGSLSLIQAATGNLEQDFGGLAQRRVDPSIGTATSDADARAKAVLSDRALGSVGDPNRYGQLMLVLLPWAIFLFYVARTRSARRTVLLLAGLVLAGIVLTHSRGAFVTLLGLGTLMCFLGVVRARVLASLLLPVMVVAMLVAPSYLSRIQSIADVSDLFAKQQSRDKDQVIRGRATEMLAALHVFRDHPILGVGPGQYAPFYSLKYQDLPEVKYRLINRPRRAHSLYLEMAAETGFIGLALFLSMPIYLLVQFWKVRARWLDRAPDIALAASTMGLSLLAYLGTGVFLHLAYARYYWFLLAICGATLQLIRQFERQAQSATT